MGRETVPDGQPRAALSFFRKEIKPKKERHFVPAVIVPIKYGFRGLLLPGSHEFVKDLALKYNLPVYLFGQYRDTCRWAVYKTDSGEILEEGEGLNVFFSDPDAESFSEYLYWTSRIHENTKERKKIEFQRRAEKAENNIGKHNIPVELKEHLTVDERDLN